MFLTAFPGGPNTQPVGIGGEERTVGSEAALRYTAKTRSSLLKGSELCGAGHVYLTREVTCPFVSFLHFV